MSTIIRRLKEENIESIIWREELPPYTDMVLQTITEKIEQDKILHLINEMRDCERRLFAKSTGMSMYYKNSSALSLFKKELSQLLRGNSIKGSMQSFNNKVKVFFAIIESILHIHLMEDKTTIKRFCQQQDVLIEENGIWHYYWAFYFHPGREAMKSFWEKELQKLQFRIDELEKFPVKGMPEQDYDEGRKDATKDRLIQKLEHKIKIEMEKRIEYERVISQKESMVKKQTEEIDGLNDQIKSIESEAHQWQTKLERTVETMSNQEQQWNLKRKEWDKDRKNYIEKAQSLEAEIIRLKGKTEKLPDLERRIAALKEENKQLVKQLEEEKQPSFLTALDRTLTAAYGEIGNLSTELLMNPEQRRELKERIQSLFKLTDTIELFHRVEKEEKDLIEQKEEKRDVKTEEKTNVKTEEKTEVQEAANEEKSPLLEKKAPETEVEQYLGTFYRREHGGFIELENGAAFNIPESLVLELELQHKAEVLCTAIGNGRYNIQLLLQGDDDDSPIDTFEGYLELGDNHKWYCVPLHDPIRRYLVHSKDVEVLRLIHGVPCSFNVRKEGFIARISKIYDFSKETGSPPFKQSNQKKREDQNSSRGKEKPDPFLENCKVAIIGGMRRWFEEVVLETGAELIYDDGTSPERIYTQLSRANALFLLLTANSHRATNGSIEVAKQNNIPHFIIQGSKSNLKKLLWENREIIKGNTQKNSSGYCG